MIISHTYRYIFLKTKKTAGTSVELALSRSCGPHDVVTGLPPKDEKIREEIGGRGRQNHRVPPLQVSVHQHDGARRCRNAIGAETFESYYRFAIERNPWDAVVSMYFWVNRNSHRFSFEEFLHSDVVSNMVKQNYRIWHIQGEPVVNRMLRYERLGEDLDELWDHLGLPGRPDLPGAKSGFRPTGSYRDMYDDAGRERVAELFSQTIRELDYRF